MSDGCHGAAPLTRYPLRASAIHCRLLAVALYDGGWPELGLFGIQPGLAPGTPLAQQIPALVELHLGSFQLGLFLRRETLAGCRLLRAMLFLVISSRIPRSVIAWPLVLEDYPPLGGTLPASTQVSSAVVTVAHWSHCSMWRHERNSRVPAWLSTTVNASEDGSSSNAK